MTTLDRACPMRVYLVGGAVRDRLLGRPIQERDWVVTGATPSDLQKRGLRAKDASIPVFTDPETGDEYALARRERKHGEGHRGFAFDAAPDVTLEEDLARRDLTINAMAEDESGALVDPWHGMRDLRARQLRHVTPAFAEDPLRVVRLARFAAQLAEFDFRIAPETERLAAQMSEASELLTLSPGRLWRELSKALASHHPEVFLHCLHRFGALTRLLPWLTPRAGPQLPVRALERACELSPDPAVRLTAAMLCAARNGAAGPVPDDWPLPAPVRALYALALQHPLPHTTDAGEVLRWLEDVDAYRRGERFTQLLTVWRSVCPDEGPHLDLLAQVRDASLQVPPPGRVPDPRAAVRAARLSQIRSALATTASGDSL